MSKRIFSPNQHRRESGLGRIVLGLLVSVAAIYAVIAGVSYLRSGGEAAPDAPEVMTESGGSSAPATSSSAAAPSEPVAGKHPKLAEAEAAEKAGDNARAKALYEDAVKQLAQTPEYPAAAAGLARVLLASGDRDRALTLFTEVRDRAPAPLRAAALSGLAADSEAQGDPVKARDLYKQAFTDAEINSETWNQALDNLGRLNVELVFSTRETPDSKYHTIEPGESITSIGIKLNTTQGLLMRANNVTDPATLRAGQRLKHTPKDFRILVERSTCRLFLLDSDGVFKRYGTGLGMPGYETALGTYTIGNKQKDPTWFKPGSEPIPPNDPANELGTRWMPLMPQEEGLPTDLGIHGTIEPASIGQYKSHGCPRLLKEDVEELYDLVVRSTPVSIVEVIDWKTLGPAEAAIS